MKKVLKIIIPIVAVVLASVIIVFSVFFNKIFWDTEGFIEKSQTADLTIRVNEKEQGKVLDGFGASACWWSQIAGKSENGEEIIKLLYSKDGLGLNIYRYNVGAGSADSQTLISDPWHQTESFYVYNESKGEYEYDFTRDAAAQKMLDSALSYG